MLYKSPTHVMIVDTRTWAGKKKEKRETAYKWIWLIL